MSFLLGPVSGALVAGGLYYGYSSMMQTRTQTHIRDLHTLSVHLVETPALINAPHPAASRITPRPFSNLLQSRWNQEIASMYAGLREWDVRAMEWGKRLLYGEETRSSAGAGERS
ncbi:hypothetical protein MSAN_00975100 [Mycena sanguinolenta]|uniref:MICOS complex subunit MIC12 n=1 Tax=Mycena sanguinolenta TaxID=230812 RepID=A0A8H6YXR3_9AGAR|nr:hypothetical protein MSAN_00975100 [Mycena sanguinolenta]